MSCLQPSDGLARTPHRPRLVGGEGPPLEPGGAQVRTDPIADPAGYQATLRRVQALLWRDDSVLEIGCGTGTTALRLAGHTRRWLATDMSTEMIAIAREKLAAQPGPPLRFEGADADAPAPGGARLDAVLAFNVLHWCRTWTRRSARRRLH